MNYYFLKKINMRSSLIEFFEKLFYNGFKINHVLKDFPILVNILILIASIFVGWLAIVSFFAAKEEKEGARIYIILASICSLIFLYVLISGTLKESFDVIMFELAKDN